MITSKEIQDLLRQNAHIVCEVADVEDMSPDTIIVGPKEHKGLYRVTTVPNGIGITDTIVVKIVS